MNGVHDIGGMDGFGAIERETHEPVFHEPWESRVFGMALTGAGLPPTPIDAFRHRLERLDPVKYLGSSYYERWLAAMETALIETNTLSRDEIDARVEQFAADPELPMPRREDPARAEGIANAVRAGRPESQRAIRRKPRFAIGDKIVTRNLNPHGHTRLPRYARGKRGVIAAHYGAHVFPDANAHGLGENPQHLYSVRIAARELWGANAEANENVLIDMWESYLEKDKTAAKPLTRKSAPAAKKVAAKEALEKTPARAATRTSPRPQVTLTSPIPQKSGRGTGKGGKATGNARSTTSFPRSPKRGHIEAERSSAKALPSVTRASPLLQKSRRATDNMRSSPDKNSKGSTAAGRGSARSERASGKPKRRSR